MQYKETVTVPSGATKDDPYTQRIQLTEGTLSRLVVDIPAGHEGLAGMSLWRAGTQLYPFTPNEWFRGNDTNIRIDDELQLDQPPFYLTFKGYNNDDTYDHGFHLMVGVNRPGENPVEQVYDLLKETKGEVNYPSDSWLDEVGTDLEEVNVNLAQNILPKLDQLKSLVEQIKSQGEKTKGVEELSRF